MPCGFDHIVPYFYVIYFGALLGKPLHTRDLSIVMSVTCCGIVPGFIAFLVRISGILVGALQCLLRVLHPCV